MPTRRFRIEGLLQAWNTERLTIPRKWIQYPWARQWLLIPVWDGWRKVQPVWQHGGQVRPPHKMLRLLPASDYHCFRATAFRYVPHDADARCRGNSRPK